MILGPGGQGPPGRQLLEEVFLMPNVMIRRSGDGELSFYIAKKDLEARVVSVETDTRENWGGEVELDDGSRYYIDPVSPPPTFPTTLRFKRM